VNGDDLGMHKTSRQTLNLPLGVRFLSISLLITGVTLSVKYLDLVPSQGLGIA
jgi:hypothetical protein